MRGMRISRPSLERLYEIAPDAISENPARHQDRSHFAAPGRDEYGYSVDLRPFACAQECSDLPWLREPCPFAQAGRPSLLRRRTPARLAHKSGDHRQWNYDARLCPRKPAYVCTRAGSAESRSSYPQPSPCSTPTDLSFPTPISSPRAFLAARRTFFLKSDQGFYAAQLFQCHRARVAEPFRFRSEFATDHGYAGNEHAGKGG